ncbi:ECF RNA polymerase sigma factor SigW [compost metagenome]|uniref:RNA polymerase sigma factor n=1 Tax=Sphingobacterium detergens TaxID=1145106 RepID=UPI000F9D9774
MNTETAIQRQADRELVSQILQRDPHAFHKLIVDHEKLVAHLVYKMIPVVADRRDIIQDVYIKVHNNLRQFRFQSKLSTWIGQITYNTCLHYLQKKRPILMESFFENADLSYTDYKIVQAASNETENRLFARELSQTIAQAVAQLSALYQTLIGLHYQQELSLQEISEITQLPEGTIKSYLFRARKQLKDILLKSQKREEL